MPVHTLTGKNLWMHELEYRFMGDRSGVDRDVGNDHPDGSRMKKSLKLCICIA